MERIYLKSGNDNVDDLFDKVSKAFLSLNFRTRAAIRYESDDVGVMYDATFTGNNSTTLVKCWTKPISIREPTPDGPLTFPKMYRGTILFIKVGRDDINRVIEVLGQTAYRPTRIS